MSVAARLAVFVSALVLVAVGAVGIGRATGPVGPVGPADDEQAAHAGDDGAEHGTDDGAEHGDHGDHGSSEVGALSVSQQGYRLALEQTSYEPGVQPLAFRVEDGAGEALTDYEVDREQELHLVLVRRDGEGFQHLHPALGGDGTWRSPAELTPGWWRVIVDFSPAGGDRVTLGADVVVPGTPELVSRGTVLRAANDGEYAVTLDGDLVVGQDAALTATVTRNGVPVTDLEPHLGEVGHMVVLREGDLGYLHAHAEDGPAGPTLGFAAPVPSAGRYYVYVEFRHLGAVHTADFTLETTGLAAGSGGGHDHH